jgi:hypothetical protein
MSNISAISVFTTICLKTANQEWNKYNGPRIAYYIIWDKSGYHIQSMDISILLFSGYLNTNVDFSDFIFVKLYRKQKLFLNHKKIKAV